MIAILDTNLLISALLNPHSLPAKLVDAWTARRYALSSSEEQIAEYRRVSRYPKVASLISAPLAGRLVKELRANALFPQALPTIDACRDPMDNFLLAMAEAGRADFLVTGDKLDLLSMQKHGATAIVSARQFAAILRI